MLKTRFAEKTHYYKRALSFHKILNPAARLMNVHRFSQPFNEINLPSFFHFIPSLFGRIVFLLPPHRFSNRETSAEP